MSGVSASARLRVLRAGPLTNLQDRGRPGQMRFGVPLSGPIDRQAFAAARLAVGAAEDAVGIEISLGGLELACVAGEVGFAVCGGDFAAEIDGQVLGPWARATLRAGSVLRVREGRIGNWAYLVPRGDVRCDRWGGSASTHLLAGLGGGRLAAGADLWIERAAPMLAPGALPRLGGARPIETALIIPGPQERFFAPGAGASIAAECYHATARFDRMGMALDGPSIVPTRIDMASEPAWRGALQIDGAGRLTLLSADHQTTSGYPKLATVVDADVDRVAQLRAGSPIRFAVGDQAQAAARRAERREELAAFATALRALDRPLQRRLEEVNLIDGIVDAMGRGDRDGSSIA